MNKINIMEWEYDSIIEMVLSARSMGGGSSYTLFSPISIEWSTNPSSAQNDSRQHSSNKSGFKHLYKINIYGNIVILNVRILPKLALCSN